MALWRDGDGRHKRTLGPARAKPHGKTAKGAVKWRAADGPKPEGHLTPRGAEAALARLLGEAPPEPTPASARHTFGEACSEWLRYVEHDRARRPSTVGDYHNTVQRYLVPAFGADRSVAAITSDDIDAFRERCSRRPAVAPDDPEDPRPAARRHEAAKRRKWIASNPAEDAERITLKRSGDFSVLSPEEVEAVARAARDQQDAAVFLTAAFSGLALDGLSRRDWFTGPSDLVFCNEVGGFIDDGRLRTRFYAALRDAGLGHLRDKEDRVVFHDLPHTFGTLAVRAFPLSDVKAFMGHESIDTTMIYVHHIAQDRRGGAAQRPPER